jgi:hypothetical protein
MGSANENMKRSFLDWSRKKRYELKKEEKKILFFKNKNGTEIIVGLICGRRVDYKKLNQILAQLGKNMSEQSRGYIFVSINSLSSVLQEYTKKLGFGIIEIDSKGKIITKTRPKEKIPLLSKISQQTTRKNFKDNVGPIIGKDELEKFLNVCSEDEFTEMIFEPLFTNIGFDNVSIKGHRERRGEFGQDIRLMKLKLPTGHYLYFVAQIKTSNIASSHIDDILSQLNRAYNKKIFDYDINKNLRTDHVFLIYVGHITEDARTYLNEQLEFEERRGILIIDRMQLIRLYSQYGLPVSVQDKISHIVNERNH